MRRVLKVAGIVFGMLVMLVLFGLLSIYLISEQRLNKTYDVPVEVIDIPSGAAAVDRGRHLVMAVALCTDCHGKNLSGEYFDDGPLVGRISIKNLTSGRGGIGSTMTDEDWVRAIRYGVGKDGKSLIDMPTNLYYKFSDEDLGAMIAYLKTLPRVDNELPPKYIGLLTRIFILRMPTMLSATTVDHTGPRPPAPEPGPTAAYGEYLANVCKQCHGENLSGNNQPGAGFNLTPGGDLADWSEIDFFVAMRTGLTPEGKKLDPELMPWDQLRMMSDEELRAIWLYLQSVPAVETREAAR